MILPKQNPTSVQQIRFDLEDTDVDELHDTIISSQHNLKVHMLVSRFRELRTTFLA